MLHFENILHSVPTICEIYLFGILSAFISCLFWLGPPCHAIFFAFLLYLYYEKIFISKRQKRRRQQHNTTCNTKQDTTTTTTTKGI